MQGLVENSFLVKAQTLVLMQSNFSVWWSSEIGCIRFLGLRDVSEGEMHLLLQVNLCQHLWYAGMWSSKMYFVEHSFPFICFHWTGHSNSNRYLINMFVIQGNNIIVILTKMCLVSSSFTMHKSRMCSVYLFKYLTLLNKVKPYRLKPSSEFGHKIH